MMEIKTWQQKADLWIKTHGVRYFDIKTNALLLTEEVGEFARLVARQYGEQSFKKATSREEVDRAMADEIGDILFVLTCISNQMGIDLEQVLNENLKKKTNRDSDRHIGNKKLR